MRELCVEITDKDYDLQPHPRPIVFILQDLKNVMHILL